MSDASNTRFLVLDSLARYALALDADERETYLATFEAEATLAFEGPDGVVTLEVRGTRAIGKVFDAQLAHRRGRTRHVPGLPLFDAVDATSARTRTPFVVTVAQGPDVRAIASGLYRDVWVVEGDRARLASRVVVLDAPLG